MAWNVLPPCIAVMGAILMIIVVIMVIVKPF